MSLGTRSNESRHEGARPLCGDANFRDALISSPVMRAATGERYQKVACHQTGQLEPVLGEESEYRGREEPRYRQESGAIPTKWFFVLVSSVPPEHEGVFLKKSTFCLHARRDLAHRPGRDPLVTLSTQTTGHANQESTQRPW